MRIKMWPANNYQAEDAIRITSRTNLLAKFNLRG